MGYAEGYEVRTSNGAVAVYRTCTDPGCPAHREGYCHDHLISMERADTAPSGTARGRTHRIDNTAGQN